MVIKNKNVRRHVDKYLLNQVQNGAYENLFEAYGDFYKIRDRVKIEYIVSQAIQEMIENMGEDFIVFGKYVYYPDTGYYCYFD